MLTLHLGDRKSESYALQWKHVDLENGYISLIQNKYKMGNLKTTKGIKRLNLCFLLLFVACLSNGKHNKKVNLVKLTSSKQEINFFSPTQKNW